MGRFYGATRQDLSRWQGIGSNAVVRQVGQEIDTEVSGSKFSRNDEQEYSTEQEKM